jgi:hypothetical protein
VVFDVVHFEEYVTGGGIHDNASSKLRTGNEYVLIHLRGNFTIWICSSGLGRWVWKIFRNLFCCERLFKRSSRSSGISFFHSLSLSASIPAKSFCFSALIAFLSSLIGSSLLILTEKAFAVVLPLTSDRHFSGYIVFFAKCYWCKLAYMRTSVWFQQCGHVRLHMTNEFPHILPF